jgi:hypothetical protein
MNISYEAERAINISNILRVRTKQFTISKKLILLGILNTSYEDEESIFKPITGYSLKEKKRFNKQAQTYLVNIAKWKAAEIYCRQNGMEFLIITERTLDKWDYFS